MQMRAKTGGGGEPGDPRPWRRFDFYRHRPSDPCRLTLRVVIRRWIDQMFQQRLRAAGLRMDFADAGRQPVVIPRAVFHPVGARSQTRQRGRRDLDPCGDSQSTQHGMGICQRDLQQVSVGPARLRRQIERTGQRRQRQFLPRQAAVLRQRRGQALPVDLDHRRFAIVVGAVQIADQRDDDPRRAELERGETGRFARGSQAIGRRPDVLVVIDAILEIGRSSGQVRFVEEAAVGVVVDGEMAVVGLGAARRLLDQPPQPIAAVPFGRMMPSSALRLPPAFERFALAQHVIHRMPALMESVIVMHLGALVHLARCIERIVRKEQRASVPPQRSVATRLVQRGQPTVGAAECGSHVQVQIMPRAAVMHFARHVTPRRQHHSARRPQPHVVPDAGHQRPQNRTVSVAVDVQQLDRIADRAELAQPVAAFQHLVHVKHAAVRIDQIAVQLPSQGVVLQVPPARELAKRPHAVRIRPMR